MELNGSVYMQPFRLVVGHIRRSGLRGKGTSLDLILECGHHRYLKGAIPAPGRMRCRDCPRLEIKRLGDTCIIPLSQGQFAIVDDADFELLMQWKWSAVRAKKGLGWYAARARKINGKSTVIYMHRFILGFPEGIDVDHRDGNGLNNRRTNIRTATPQQNAFNRKASRLNKSGYKGVVWLSLRRRWRADIRVGGKTKLLGYFMEAKEAAESYNKAAKEMHGDFAAEATP